MKISERWRIVPQLGLLFALLSRSLVVVAAEPLPPAPPVPTTVAEARTFMDGLEPARLQAQRIFEQREAGCYQRTFISGCLRELEADKARYKRDLQVSEVAARELLRLEAQAEKDRQRQPASAGIAVPSVAGEQPVRETADAPDVPLKRTPKPPRAEAAPITDASGETAVPTAGASQVSPALTLEEQARNRAAYAAKQEKAARRQAENEVRQAELTERRKRYREEQAKKAERAAARAGSRATTAPAVAPTSSESVPQSGRTDANPPR